MTFIKKIISYIKDIFSGFRKSEVIEILEGVSDEGTKRKLNVINQRIEGVLEKGESYSGQAIELLGYKTNLELESQIGAKNIIASSTSQILKVKTELSRLNNRIYEIDSKKRQLQQIAPLEIIQVDKELAQLEQILKGESYTSSTKSILNKIVERNSSFESIFEKKGILKIFEYKEAIKLRREQNKTIDIQKRFSLLREIINSDELVNISRQIRILNTQILSISDLGEREDFLSKLNVFKQILQRKEVKRQAAVLEEQRQAVEAKRIEEREKRKKEAAKKQREKTLQEAEALAKKRKKEKKKQKLKNLSIKKSNWKEYKRVLEENNITTFYHFTESANLKSIRKYGGLFSWHYCDTNGIVIPKTGGDFQSRNLDTRFELEDFVRLSFCNDHPMQYRLEQSNYNLVLLKIEISVAYFKNTLFSDINATDRKHKLGSSINDLKRVKFSATKRSYVRREDPDFKPHQAEILVKTHIPIKYISNINQV